MRSHNSSGVDNRNRADLMVIDTRNINGAMRVIFNNPGVTTGNATIGAAINKRSFLATGSLRHAVLNVVKLDLSYILVSVDGECIFLDSNLLGCLDRLREDCTNISWVTGWRRSVGMFGDHGNQDIINIIHRSILCLVRIDGELGVVGLGVIRLECCPTRLL